MVGRMRLVVMCGLATAVGAVVAIPASATGHANTTGTKGNIAIIAGTTKAVEPGPATASPLGARGVAVDSSGNLYIADALNNDVEKVTPAGTLSIVAGTGTAGTPAPGPATSSDLDLPSGVAVDSSGNVYIADTNNNEVEKVTPGGMLSIVAGTGTAGAPTAGTATSSELNDPSGVAVDSSGNVYIADAGNNEIEEVYASTGDLSVFAGTGTAGEPTAGVAATSSELHQPSGVAVDSSGNVYIADSGNAMIEEVPATGTDAGTVEFFAGEPDESTGLPTHGPATSTALNRPDGVAVDASGNVYIADIESVDEVAGGAGGTLSIVASIDGDAALSTTPTATADVDLENSMGVAVDSSGDVYVADNSQSEVAKVSGGNLSVVAGIDNKGTPTPGPATSSTLYEPNGVAVDASGNTYIADGDFQSSFVEKVTPSGQLSIIAGDGESGTPTPGLATSSALAIPVGVAVDASDNVYIADGGGPGSGSEILKVTPSGTLTVVAGDGSYGAPTTGSATSSPLGYATGVAVDSSGNLYITERSPSEVLEVNASTGDLSIIAGTTTTGTPTSGQPATSSDLDDPSGVAVNASGNVYFADRGNDEVDEISGGTLTIIAGTGPDDDDDDARPASEGATSIQLDNPYGVAVDASGNVYIADSGDEEVDRVTPSGALSILAGTGTHGLPTPGPATSSKLNDPAGVAVDGNDDVFIADEGNADVEEVFGVTTTTTTTGTGTTTTTGTGTTTTGTGTTTTTTTATGTSTTPTPAPTVHVTSVHTDIATTTVAITCRGQSNQRCVAKLTLTTTYRVRVRVHNRTRTVTKTVTIGSATVTLAGGKTRTVTIALNHAGTTLLKTDKKLTAKLAVAQGTHTVKTATVHLTAPKKKH